MDTGQAVEEEEEIAEEVSLIYSAVASVVGLGARLGVDRL
jgi:hypothetical protein